MKLILIILGVLFAIAAHAIGVASIAKREEGFAKASERLRIGIPPMMLLSVAAFVLALSCTIIPSGETGVLITYGQVDPQVLNNGIHFTIPFIQSVEVVNNKQQDISSDYQVWSETSSRTALYYSDVTVTVSIEAGESAWILANVDNYKSTLVSGSIIGSAIKASSKLLDDSDATNRAIIEPLVAETLQNSLDEKYGKRVVTINKVTIGNVDFEDSYNAAIAEKQNAQLAYEKQAIENKTSVERAQAQADAKLIAAQADAEAMQITAEAEAAANQKILESLSDIIIRYKTIEKWDGELPTVMGQNETILDVAGIVDGQP